jgi:hypothetical protein
MLNKEALLQEYFRTVALLKLKPFQVILQAGGALVALGIRESTSDLDLAIPRDVFNRLKRTHGDRIYMYGDVEVLPFTDVADLHIFTGQWPSNFETADGVYVPSIKEQLKLKTTLYNLPGRTDEKREADLRDIAALKKLSR